MDAEIPCECHQSGSSCSGWTEQIPLDQIDKRVTLWRDEYDRLLTRLAFSASQTDIIAEHIPKLEARYAKLWELEEKYHYITDLRDGKWQEDEGGKANSFDKTLLQRIDDATDNMMWLRWVMKGRQKMLLTPV